MQSHGANGTTPAWCVTLMDYVTSGIAIAIEPDAQFQNGFGAMVRSR